MNKMQEAINALENVIQAIDDAYKRGYEAKRTWVGLTDEDKKRFPHQKVDGAYDWSFDQGVAWAEDKLKEKNDN